MFQGVGRGAGTGVRVLTAGLPGKGGASRAGAGPASRSTEPRDSAGRAVRRSGTCRSTSRSEDPRLPRGPAPSPHALPPTHAPHLPPTQRRRGTQPIRGAEPALRPGALTPTSRVTAPGHGPSALVLTPIAQGAGCSKERLSPCRFPGGASGHFEPLFNLFWAQDLGDVSVARRRRLSSPQVLRGGHPAPSRSPATCRRRCSPESLPWPRRSQRDQCLATARVRGSSA